jgi:hypothetical protein
MKRRGQKFRQRTQADLDLKNRLICRCILNIACKFFQDFKVAAIVSRGFPGGPRAGRAHEVDEAFRYHVQEAMPDIRRQIRRGDIAGARVILARLDRAGNRQATLTLAETYDPALLAQWNVRGIKPDPAKAAELYQRAIDGGVSAARARLNALTGTGR